MTTRNDALAMRDELAKLMKEVNPGPEAMRYLDAQGLDLAGMVRVLKLMRTLEIDIAQDQLPKHAKQ